LVPNEIKSVGINGSPDVSDIWNVPFDNSQNSFVVQHIENLSKHLSCSYHKNQTSSILKCPSNVLHLFFFPLYCVIQI